MLIGACRPEDAVITDEALPFGSSKRVQTKKVKSEDLNLLLLIYEIPLSNSQCVRKKSVSQITPQQQLGQTSASLQNLFQNYLIQLHLPFRQKHGTTNLDGTDLINSVHRNNWIRWQ